MLSAPNQNNMPRYIYRCDSCTEEYQRTHSIKEKLVDCELCDAKDSLKRIPSTFITNFKQQKQKPGHLVKEYLGEAREDLKEQKKELEQKR